MSAASRSNAAGSASTHWLLQASLINGPEAAIFTPEALTDEHRLIGRTTAEFVGREVVPATAELEKKNWTLSRSLLVKCGDLGLLGIDVPEEHGGIGLDRATATVVSEAIGAASSFATTYGGQTGLTIVPLLYFGTPEQQRRYLPDLLAGTRVGAYCLSESGAGSDAFSARTTAVGAPDGSWTLTGEKMWISNGGFADIFIVFAQAEGQLSTFIVERAFGGVASGAEEHKMGLDGSSTTPVVFSDVRVPDANRLGDVGAGRRIAYGVLNYGRFKLAATCCGAAKASIAEAAAYASSRRQFGQAILEFGAIRQKLAEMAIRIYAVESMLYRTAGLIDAATVTSPDAAREIADAAGGAGRAMAAACDRYALEASLLKIAGSEMLGFVTDEQVQIFGGNGFVKDYPAERRYRDARINRIFEGTNEINRLLAVTLLRKRLTADGTSLDSLDAVDGPGATNSRAERRADEQDELAAVTAAPVFAAAIARIARLAIASAARAFGDALIDRQEVVLRLADLLVDAFAADSVTKRAEAARAMARPDADTHADAAAVFAYEARARAATAARTVICAVETGATREATLLAIERAAAVPTIDTIAARRRVADAVTQRVRYPFGGF